MLGYTCSICIAFMSNTTPSRGVFRISGGVWAENLSLYTAEEKSLQAQDACFTKLFFWLCSQFMGDHANDRGELCCVTLKANPSATTQPSSTIAICIAQKMYRTGYELMGMRQPNPAIFCPNGEVLNKVATFRMYCAPRQ